MTKIWFQATGSHVLFWKGMKSCGNRSLQYTVHRRKKKLFSSNSAAQEKSPKGSDIGTGSGRVSKN